MIANANIPLSGLAAGDYLVRLNGAATRGGPAMKTAGEL